MEREIVTEFAKTLIPLPSEKLGKSVEAVDVASNVDDHLKYFSKDLRLSFRALLLLFDWGAFFYYLRCKPFRRLKPEWKKRYLEAWHNSSWAPKRALWRFLDAIIYMNYYTDEEVYKACGWTPSYKKRLPEPVFPHENVSIAPSDKDMKVECDVCVIGSGAGGAAIAAKLAKAGRKVVILEEGGYFTSEDFGSDAVVQTKMLYRDGGMVNTFGWPAILVPVGKCVGGTTTINSGTCFRTPPELLDKWALEFGLSTWNAERMRPYFEEAEEMLGVAPAADNVLRGNTHAFIKGIEKLGFKGAPLLRNSPACTGSGVCCFGCPTNAKRSMNISYIPEALRHGAKLFCHCQASRFLYEGGHATTVIARFRDPLTRKRLASLEVKAKTIVLACGTLHTPVLLMRSHVPNMSGQIGHNLTLHPAAKVIGIFKDEIRGWDEIPQGYYVDALKKEGIMLEGIFLPPSYMASSLLHTGERHRQIMERYNNLAVFGLMVSDTSKGRILRLPGNRPVTIYNLNKADLKKFISGLEVLAQAFFAAGAESVLLPIHTAPEITREEGACAVKCRKIRQKDLDLAAFHPLGTCRMGANPKEAVCDPFGRVYGLDNVFISDGSIFPTSLGVNPMMSIIAAGLKIGDYINREVL